MIKNNKKLMAFASRHEKFFNYLKIRLAPKNFWGLPLSIGILLLLYFLGHFLGITAAILNSDPIVFLDVRIENLIATLRQPMANNFFYWCSALASWQFILSAFFLVCLILWLNKQKTKILPFLISLSGTAIFIYALKLIIQRPRPENVAIIDITNYSFPSGHAALAVAFWGFICYLLLNKFRNLKARIFILITILTIIAFIGFSRLYLGVHYLSDVLGGIWLGLLFLAIGLIISEKQRWADKNQPAAKNKNKIWLSFILIGLILFSYIFTGLIYKPEFNLTPAPINYQNVSDPAQIFNSPFNLPKFTETPTAQQQEPVSLIFIAQNDSVLINELEKAGWLKADTLTLSNIFKIVFDVILNKPYLRAPFTPSFWNGQVHNFGVEKATINNPSQRHHARIWDSRFKTPDGRIIYVATASFDQGIKWLFTHKISPDIDADRELLFNDLLNNSLIVNSSKIQLINTNFGQNFTGDFFYTDGKTYIIFLR